MVSGFISLFFIYYKWARFEEGEWARLFESAEPRVGLRWYFEESEGLIKTLKKAKTSKSGEYGAALWVLEARLGDQE